MIRIFLRLIGLAMLAGAFVAAVIDGARSIAADQLALTPIGEPLYQAMPNKFLLVQAFIEHKISPRLWDPVLNDILLLPTWFILAIFGAALVYLTRKRPPPIGHSNRSR
jgi:hypothetical protein